MVDNAPTKACDLIMKGGITSGVVYPGAIATIAKDYRFHGIGGTSAGAIGAVIAAAAEYRRQSSETKASMEGFKRIGDIPDEIGKDLAGMFQPSPELRKPFNLMIRSVGAQGGKNTMRVLARGILREYWPSFAFGAFIGVATAHLLIANIAADSPHAGLIKVLALLTGLILALLLPFVDVGRRLYANVATDLPKRHFGLCTGKTQPGGNRPAFTDWMHRKIESVAGNEKPRSGPLTIGDLSDCDIALASMTTDLSSHRPYQLPLQTRTHFFSESEFRALLPDDVVDYLVETAAREAEDRAGSGEPEEEEARGPLSAYGLSDFHRLPVGRAFPVLLVARMSLSFPALISAVPLYRFDYTVKSETQPAPLRRCLFSDGGISSNFPIHFFDAMLPRRPTFGITLGKHEEERHADKPRTELPRDRLQPDGLPIDGIGSVGGFLMSIVNTAKDWQDTLQSLMPGYSERIARVRLSPDQGGMNLTMDKKTIETLSGYGDEAGARFVEEFDFDEHRYRRAISLLPTLQGSLSGYAQAWSTDTKIPYPELLRDHEVEKYEVDPGWRRETFEPFAAQLAGIGAEAAENSLTVDGVPHIDADVRLLASANRVPKDVAKPSRVPESSGPAIA